MPSPERPTKTCVACGREMTWRKKWARNWAEVKYCSGACRRGNSQTARAMDARLESMIRELLAQRPRGSTICPSEVARAVRPDDWRSLMEPTRSAARRLAAAGELVVTQGGKVIDPIRAKGPVRLRRV